MSMDFNIFSMVPIEVLADRRLTLEQMRVLIGILSFRNKSTDVVWPGREELSARCGGMHPSNISSATTALCNLGWLTKKGGNNRATRYTVTVPDLDAIVADSATSKKNGKVAESATSDLAESATSDLAESATSDLAESATSDLAESATSIEQTKEHTKEQTNTVASGKQVSKIGWDVPDKMFKGITPERMDAWQRAFPGFDVEGELTRIDLWYDRRLRESPRFRWKNAERGIHNWLSRAYTDLRKPKVFVKQQAPATQPTR